jgi:hypothetical protein
LEQQNFSKSLTHLNKKFATTCRDKQKIKDEGIENFIAHFTAANLL